MRDTAFHNFTGTPGTTRLRVRFDVERDTPMVLDAVASQLPEIRPIVARLRESVPLAPHSGIGAAGEFVRLPNHYRSISWPIPSTGTVGDRGVIVLKGTEPLLPDFPEYVDWMLRAPFRGTYLPLGLFFPLEMKLPPGAMWLEECLLEQRITSRIQVEYLAHYQRLARLPVPLFVYELAEEQAHHYRAVVRARMPAAAFTRCEAKVAGGLGVEVYYYPSLPVRAADLFANDIRAACASALAPQALDGTFRAWIGLLGEMLHLGYMPYAPWNHGMGACVDPGNACIDGGFNDMLTIVPFDSIPGEFLFSRSLVASIQMLASSIVAVCSVAAEVPTALPSDAPPVSVAYVTERLRTQLSAGGCTSHSVGARLRRFFDTPSVEDVFQHLRETHRDMSAIQFRNQQMSASFD